MTEAPLGVGEVEVEVKVEASWGVKVQNQFRGELGPKTKTPQLTRGGRSLTPAGEFLND